MVIRRPRQTFREFLNKRLANSLVESLNELMEQATSRLFSLMLFPYLVGKPCTKGDGACPPVTNQGGDMRTIV